jgi:hypothetical protein
MGPQGIGQRRVHDRQPHNEGQRAQYQAHLPLDEQRRHEEKLAADQKG